ncbi:MAG: tetratricopeptide repeat protein [Thaumarchaeota archaeon]|nr:tetratricopeptide repeat protein [Nitrososphaerota archaeon]
MVFSRKKNSNDGIKISKIPDSVYGWHAIIDKYVLLTLIGYLIGLNLVIAYSSQYHIDQFTLIALFTEMTVGITVAKIVYNISKKNEKENASTLAKVTKMVKEDYDLKTQRKYQIVQNLQMLLSVEKQATDFIAGQMRVWLDEKDKTKQNEIKNQVFEAYSQIEYGYERLKDIRKISIDVIDARISNDIELLINCFKDRPEFEDDKNSCYPDPWVTAGYITERIQAQILEIRHSDPDSFESNLTCTMEEKTMEDGSKAKISVVRIKTDDDKKSESKSWIDKSLKSDSSNLTKLCQKAFELSIQGKHSASISYCDQVLGIEPTNILAKTNKGYALDNLGMHKEAIALYDEVLATEPENILALINKGMAYMMWGKLKDAIPCFKKSVEVDPRNVRGWQNLGYSYFYSKQFIQAKEAFEKLLQIDPNNTYGLHMKEQAEKNELKQ